ncbi:hypothetical protein TNCV_1559791 [Trichonephila clavipes]|nr:hypothetical protein TNCV_1559791 [Trichonephila clavipes]
MTPKWSPKSPNWPQTWSPKIIPTWLYRQGLNRHYNKICSQTKIPSKEHLGWGIASGFVNGTHVGKQEKGQFLVPVPLITGYQEREAVLDGPIEPLYHAVRLRMQSCCPGFVDGEYFPQCPANWRIEVSPLFIVQL